MTASETIARYSLGCPFTTQPEAPTPPTLDSAVLTAVFSSKNKIREEWITNTMSTRNCQRFDAAIEYDMNHAPKTTNLEQLREIGVFVPSLDWINESSDQEIHLALWQIIYGLATLGVYLTNTNSRTDRALLDRLCTAVLQDTIADIPPTPDMNEFIDLGGFLKVVDRDRLLPTPNRISNSNPLDDFLDLFNSPEDSASN